MSEYMIDIDNLGSYFDHTILKSDATIDEINNLIDEAIQYKFSSVCVNSYYVSHCYERLKDSNINVCAVIGFPLGTMSTDAKVYECNYCINNGAKEIDMVINNGLLKSGKLKECQDDLEAVIKLCHSHQVICKVILEICVLSPEQIIQASEISIAAGADFIKTSTGFNTHGATEDSIKTMTMIAHRNNKKVKASGGIRDGITALKYIQLKADRLGTSATVKIYNDIVDIMNNPKNSNSNNDIIKKDSNDKNESSY